MAVAAKGLRSSVYTRQPTRCLWTTSSPSSAGAATSSSQTNSTPTSRRRNMHALQVAAPDLPTPYTLATTTSSYEPRPINNKRQLPPLSILPLPNLLRSYAITAFSSYPLLLPPSLRVLAILAHSKSALLSPDRNPVLHYILKRTFYAQFCAGETQEEVHQTVKGLKAMGMQGVILSHGKELVLEKGEREKILDDPSSEVAQTVKEVNLWKNSLLSTIALTGKGEFAAMKFSGAGSRAVKQLLSYSNNPDQSSIPFPALEAATTELCEAAVARGVGLLIDAEQFVMQDGIDAWTLEFQRRYNRIATKSRPVVYGTYQAYLRRCPQRLMEHLHAAQRDNFQLGVKLVRGAYMSTDPRDLFWPSQTATDAAYDGIAEALITRTWNNTLSPSLPRDGERGMNIPVPKTSVVLASHNVASVRKALLLQQQGGKDEGKGAGVELCYSQLMGMADELSCELAQHNTFSNTPNGVRKDSLKQDGMTSVPAGTSVYKYVVWGSVAECLGYLVRRAEENRDAVRRAKGSRIALGKEVVRRVWVGLGLS